MGRTLATIMQTIHAEQELWKPFRRALRKEDQEAFDRLWRAVRHHSVPASLANRPIPFEAMVMAMLVEISKELPVRASGVRQFKSAVHDPFAGDVQ